MAGIGQESATDNHTDARGQSIVRINSADDLEDGEYLLWGHNNAGLATNTSDVPVSYVATSGERLNQEWRADISGGDNSVGTVAISFDLTGFTFGVDPNDYALLIDSDGTFSNATIDPAVPAITGSVITFEGVTLTDGDFFTIGNSNDIDDCISLTTNTWSSVVWDCGGAPDSANNVICGNGTTVRIPVEESANNLTVDGTLDIEANATLIVKGDLEVSITGTITMGSQSTIIFRGINGSQSFSNQSGSAINLENLTISNTAGITLDDGSFTLADGLTLNTGDLNVNSSLLFTSTVTQTAHINTLPNGNAVNGPGTIQVERFRSTRNTNWGNIATSGVDTDLEDLNGEVPMSGIPGGNGYAAAIGGGGFISVWAYNNITDAYETPPNTAQPFTIGRGFEIFLGDDITTWNGKAWTLEGDIHLDPITLDMNSDGGEWNLFGNPYLGFLDWDQITTDFNNIDNDEYWYIDANLGTYVNVSAGGGSFVPPGQGFWVLAQNNADLDLDPSLHLTSGISDPTFFKRQKSNEQLMIHLLHDEEPFGGAAFLRNEPNAFIGLDDYDISPLRMKDSGACHVSIETGETDLMVNYISDMENEVSMPIRIEAGTKGTYSVNLEGIETFKNYQCISITDEGTGESYDISDNTSFSIDIGDNNVARYLTLHMGNDGSLNCDPVNGEMADSRSKVWLDNKVLNIDFQLDQPANADVVVYNILGEKIYQQSTIADFNRESINLGMNAAGTYIVSININGQIETHKVILK